MWEELFIRKTTQGGKTMKKGKKYVEAASKVEKSKLYTVEEAVKLVKETSVAKFD